MRAGTDTSLKRRGRLMPIALIVGVLGLLGALAAAFLGLPGGWPAYLFGYLFWTGVAVGSLTFVLMLYLVRPSWGFAIQRLLEAAGRTLPLMAVLFIPVAIGLPQIYYWADPAHVAADPILQGKQAYLNIPFFLIRTAIYFAIWILLAYRTSSLSRRYDQTADGAILGTLRGMGAGGLLLMAVTATFASIDWMMSLDPLWVSSIYGLLVVIGWMLTAFAFVVALSSIMSRREPLAPFSGRGRLNDWGSLLLTFVIMWTYLAYSQFMLIWAANITEEVPWYAARLNQGWQYVSMVLLVFGFIFPFVVLIFRDIKRNRWLLAAIAAFVFLMQIVNTFWLIVPSFANGVGAVWPYLAALLGVGGLWLAFFAYNLAQAPLLTASAPAPSTESGLVPEHGSAPEHARSAERH